MQLYVENGVKPAVRNRSKTYGICGQASRHGCDPDHGHPQHRVTGERGP